MSRLQGAIVGFFPGLDLVGGIQVSGRMACAAVRDWAGDRAKFVCYRGAPAGIPAIHVRSKVGAAMLAFRREWNASVVVFWHIGLLKLLPLMRARSAKVVVFLHGIEAWDRRDIALEHLLLRVDLFLSNSDYTWVRFLSRYPSCRAVPHRTVHLGLGEPLNGPAPNPEERPTAIMLGRVARSEGYKGHREVLSAWQRVLKQLPKARLWIAGPGDGVAELKRIVDDRALGHSVSLLGQVSEEEKKNLLVRARTLVLPSRAEGFGLVYLESMRVGRPCLVGMEDAGREVVAPPEGGLAADARDPESLSDAICRLLTQGPDWEELSFRTRERYERVFTERHFAARLRTAMETCL